MQLGVILGGGEHTLHVGKRRIIGCRGVGTVMGRILRWPPRLELPGVHTLYNFLLLGVGGTWDYDGKSFLWLGYVRWKRWRDFADVIKVPVSWASINQKVITLGRLGQISWILKRGSSAQRFSLLLSLKNETAVNFYSFKEIHSANKYVKLEEETSAPAVTFISASWDSMQRI